MKREAKSKEWMRQHLSDPFVKAAKAQGYRSRAAFKLMEIDDHDKLIRPGMRIVDLGATPGSWAQVLAERAGPRGTVIALDLLPMDSLAGVNFILGDFREDSVLRALEAALGGAPVDLVVSDMAPNLSGVAASDQARCQHVCELALEFSREHLKTGGAMLIKAFQGSGYPEFMSDMRKAFGSVSSRKPDASRDRSAEMYLLGRGKR